MAVGGRSTGAGGRDPPSMSAVDTGRWSWWWWWYHCILVIVAATAPSTAASVAADVWQVPESVLTTGYDDGVMVFTLQGLVNREAARIPAPGAVIK